jgi:hypothetical protein
MSNSSRFKPGDICVEVRTPDIVVEVQNSYTFYNKLLVSVLVRSVAGKQINYHWGTTLEEHELELQTIFNSPLYKVLK